MGLSVRREIIFNLHVDSVSEATIPGRNISLVLSYRGFLQEKAREFSKEKRHERLSGFLRLRETITWVNKQNKYHGSQEGFELNYSEQNQTIWQRSAAHPDPLLTWWAVKLQWAAAQQKAGSALRGRAAEAAESQKGGKDHDEINLPTPWGLGGRGGFWKAVMIN